MTREEAEMVAKIMLTADGWCSSCNTGLLEQLALALPEHADAIKAVRERKDEIEEAFRAEQDKFWDGERAAKPNVWEMP